MDTKARIRIYSLEEKGVSFSYVTSSCMIVVGGRYDSKNQMGMKYEKELMEFQYIDTLVIPGWDKYSCRSLELKRLIDTYQPDRIFYPERLPTDESEQKSLEYINNYNNSEYSYAKADDDIFKDDEFVIIENGNLVLVYINKGNLALAFFSGCKNEEEKDFILQSFKDKKIDIVISGREYANDGFTKFIIETLNPNTAVGRLNPNIKIPNKKIISVQSEDIFITKVKDDIVKLRLVKDNPIEIE